VERRIIDVYKPAFILNNYVNCERKNIKKEISFSSNNTVLYSPPRNKEVIFGSRFNNNFLTQRKNTGTIFLIFFGRILNGFNKFKQGQEAQAQALRRHEHDGLWKSAAAGERP
jgi:hypothetical protein